MCIIKTIWCQLVIQSWWLLQIATAGEVVHKINVKRGCNEKNHISSRCTEMGGKQGINIMTPTFTDNLLIRPKQQRKTHDWVIKTYSKIKRKVVTVKQIRFYASGGTLLDWPDLTFHPYIQHVWHFNPLSRLISACTYQQYLSDILISLIIVML